tara:strand:- start:750 stop:1232 length:483 start_codon:yes stop_codon:yes gene_type:complete
MKGHKMNSLLDPWPWYVAGPMIGLTVPAMYLLINKPFGISRSLGIIGTLSIRKLFPHFHQKKDEIWPLYFVFGIVIGGYIGGNILSVERNPLLPLKYVNPSGLAILFAGGLLVGFGSRYANGCTSGHSITGLSYLQPVSLIATFSFFVGGLILTYLRTLI